MSTSPAALRRGCGFAQRLYRPHVEDIAFLFLRLTSSYSFLLLPAPIFLSLYTSYLRTTFASFATFEIPRIPVLSRPRRLLPPLFSRRQMRLVRFTRTRSVTRVLSAHNLGPDRSSRFVLRLSFHFFLFTPIRSILSARAASPWSPSR